jgi:hypothetical protein
MEFKNAGKPWNYDEDTLLIKLYTEDKLKLLELCEKHNRAPGGIISRLKKHNLIEEKTDVNGYNEYFNSDLYKNMVVKSKKVDKHNNDNFPSQTDNILITINKNDYTELKNDVKCIKTDIISLKKSIANLITMLNVLYEFEEI